MNKEVNFDIAKLLKDKEFIDKNMYGEVRLSQPKFYDNNGVIHNIKDAFEKTELNLRECYNAPTIAEVVMWLYEKHGIWISVSPVFEFNDGRKDYLTLQGYQYYITVITDNKYNQEKTHADRGNKNSPTEAYEAGIEYTLKNLL